MTPVPNSFVDVLTLRGTLNKLLYSEGIIDIQPKILKFLQNASDVLNEYNYSNDLENFKIYLRVILNEFNTSALANNKSIDMDKVHTALGGLVANVLHISSLDDKIITIILRHRQNIKISKVIAQLHDPEYIVKLVQNYKNINHNDLSIYRPALITSYVRPDLQIRLAHEILAQTIDYYQSNKKIFPYIDDILVVHHKHAKLISKIRPAYTYGVLSLLSNISQCKEQLSTSKYKKFVSDITSIGYNHYGKSFAQYLNIANSLSITTNVDYWHSLDLTIESNTDLPQIDCF